MYPNILVPNQSDILPIIKQFSGQYYLVGGTAIALQVGHRRSIDYDLFQFEKLDKDLIFETMTRSGYPWSLTYQTGYQVSGALNNTKITFYQYPFDISADVWFEDIIAMPSLLDLGAMKAYALGRRAKWKDYVDLFWLFKNHFSLDDLSNRASAIFGSQFNERLFREQISYFDDIDYSEKVEYIEEALRDAEIKSYLTKVAMTPF